MYKEGAIRRLVLTVTLFLLLAVLLVFVADFGRGLLRERRERAVYGTVLSCGAAFGVSPAMILAVIRMESDFKPDAVSPVGAAGLMQLLPDTFRYLREEHLFEDLPDEAIFEREVNVRYGTYYLSYLFERFGSWPLALAAYNAGEGRVSAWLRDPALFDGERLITIPYAETANYVEGALAAYRDYLEKYNFKE